MFFSQFRWVAPYFVIKSIRNRKRSSLAQLLQPVGKDVLGEAGELSVTKFLCKASVVCHYKHIAISSANPITPTVPNNTTTHGDGGTGLRSWDEYIAPPGRQRIHNDW